MIRRHYAAGQLGRRRMSSTSLRWPSWPISRSLSHAPFFLSQTPLQQRGPVLRDEAAGGGGHRAGHGEMHQLAMGGVVGILVQCQLPALR